MYAQVEKSKENKVRAVANSVTLKKSNVKQDFGFVDRLEAVAQRKLQEMANHSPHVSQLRSFQNISNNKSPVQLMLRRGFGIGRAFVRRRPALPPMVHQPAPERTLRDRIRDGLLNFGLGIVDGLGNVDNDPQQADYEQIGHLTDLANDLGLEGEERRAFFRRNGFG
ncbi:hypothetical protein VA7868_00449 [Vibrio aerogenes CECT 7868]|uniref:Uncharacterized protein n=1 Tax=Vibrio aerogenes CECT 7868 TaxID=1216006 RepID=A0A1M5VMQ3_9VIBR|nr:hypothetical protein [Vibrio aerogenes]SHH76531.1 hypothetical protein VA7868_00449 [Vibrio aerogenes CECT 7868]